MNKTIRFWTIYQRMPGVGQQILLHLKEGGFMIGFLKLGQSHGEPDLEFVIGSPDKEGDPVYAGSIAEWAYLDLEKDLEKQGGGDA